MFWGRNFGRLNFCVTPQRGFTLMEIMIVVIVISTLASVAGPTIGAITDNGRASAAKNQMANLKNAIITYKSDIGRYPHSGNNFTRANITAADLAALGEDISNNVLVNNSVMTHGIAPDIYGKRWKGPYMDSDPSEFMVDPWASKIKWVCLQQRLFLQSPGPDAVYDTPANLASFITGSYAGDDVLVMVSKISRFDKFVKNLADPLDSEAILLGPGPILPGAP